MKATFYSLSKYSNFDSAYWGLGSSTTGNVYFGLSTHLPGKNAGLFAFNPGAELIKKVWGFKDTETSHSHGKIHTPIIEGADGHMYFGTHFAYAYGEPHEVSYEGGHFLAFDPTNGTIQDFGIAHAGEGILTFALDSKNMKAYILTLPSGYLISFNIKNRKFKRLGKIPSNGSICRTLALDKYGTLYGSYEDNGLFIYNPTVDKLELLNDFFPNDDTLEWNSPSRGGVNKLGRKLWRCVTHDETQHALFGILASTSQVFSIDCKTMTLTKFSRLAPDYYNKGEDIYPTLSLVADHRRLYYVPADGLFDYSRSEKINNPSHLMTFDKQSRSIEDLGIIKDSHGTQVYGVAGATIRGNTLYLLGATEKRSDTGDVKPLFKLQSKPFDLSLIKIEL